MYSRLCRILHIAQLEKQAKLADCYCANAVVSRSFLDAANGTTFGRPIQNFAPDLLLISIQLRHAALFKECITQLMGPRNEPRYLALGDDDLQESSRSGHLVNLELSLLLPRSCKTRRKSIMKTLPPMRTWNTRRVTRTQGYKEMGEEEFETTQVEEDEEEYLPPNILGLKRYGNLPDI
jgi:hypothetical protein